MDNKTLFLEYKQLMENTRIEECYRQVIYLLKTISGIEDIYGLLIGVICNENQ